MKITYKNTCFFGLFFMLLFVQCKKEDHQNDGQQDQSITLSATKMPGHAQYSAKHEYSAAGNGLTIDVNLHAVTGIKEFYIVKTINLKIDSTYGEHGKLKVDPTSYSSQKYVFSYKPVIGDVNQLVGFTFTLVNDGGEVKQSDLTLAVNLSPRENLPLKKWQLKSVIFVNGDPPNEETIQECKKDDYMLLNSDGTWSMEYNTICFLESLEKWKTWELSEDNKTLTRISIPNVFQPNTFKTEIFDVKELTLNSLRLEQTVDMTALGGGPEDKFLYSYVPVSR